MHVSDTNTRKGANLGTTTLKRKYSQCWFLLTLLDVKLCQTLETDDLLEEEICRFQSQKLVFLYSSKLWRLVIGQSPRLGVSVLW